MESLANLENPRRSHEPHFHLLFHDSTLVLSFKMTDTPTAKHKKTKVTEAAAKSASAAAGVVERKYKTPVERAKAGETWQEQEVYWFAKKYCEAVITRRDYQLQSRDVQSLSGDNIFSSIRPAILAEVPGLLFYALHEGLLNVFRISLEDFANEKEARCIAQEVCNYFEVQEADGSCP